MKFLKKIKLYKIVYKQILKFCHLEKMKSSIKMQKIKHNLNLLQRLMNSINKNNRNIKKKIIKIMNILFSHQKKIRKIMNKLFSLQKKMMNKLFSHQKKIMKIKNQLLF